MFQLPMAQKLNHEKGTLCSTIIPPQISCYDFLFIFVYLFCCGLDQSTSLFAQIDGQKDSHEACL
jgi:hypothetical protein